VGVIIVGEHADKFEDSARFWQFFNKINHGSLIDIHQIAEKWSLWSRTGELIFALFVVEYIDEEAKMRSSVIFYRGDAVAVFLVLIDKNSGKKYVALVEQTRAAAGQKLLEIPAGGIEGEDNGVVTAIREIEEETTLEIAAKDLKFLGQYFFSPGACNEKIILYSCELFLATEEIESLQGRLTGLKEEGENIKVKLYELASFNHLAIQDAKTVLAYHLYSQGTKE
jgi:ADP-sugar diphosphatase